MSLDLLKRELLALRMFEKVKTHQKGVAQTLYVKNLKNFDELILNRTELDKLISATELEMSSSRCLAELSQPVVEAKMLYLEGLCNLRGRIIESQIKLEAEIEKLEIQLLKSEAERNLAKDLAQVKRGLIHEKLVRLSEEK